MTHKFNGSNIEATPPISSISVNKQNVVYKDHSNFRKVSLSNALEAKQFVTWLLAM
tara:strand:+ start:399 stop:566 length:168 start_codon:yes stop_codon:yes gene_type:complete